MSETRSLSLRDYVQHKDDCAVSKQARLRAHSHGEHDFVDPPRWLCDCGLDAVLRSQEPVQAQLRRQLTAFVERERALIEAKGKGGQSVGWSPSITPSVLHVLERMLR